MLHHFWTLKMGCDVAFWGVATSSTTQALTLCVLLQTREHTCSMAHTVCCAGLKHARKSNVKFLHVGWRWVTMVIAVWLTTTKVFEDMAWHTT